MKQTAFPSYLELATALNKTQSKLHPSQAHGLISGILCGNPNASAAWEELIASAKESPKTHEILRALYDNTAKELNEFLFQFKLLLPADKKDLPARAEALTLWCQGFLTGLKMTDIPIIEREPSEVTEAIDDIIEIAKMNYEEVVASEEDEAAYVELVEYVRMAVTLIYQELREKDGKKKNGTASQSKHLH